MDIAAIAVLAVAAIIHSGWNFLSKGSHDKQVFLWLAVVGSLVVFLVPFCLLYQPIPAPGWALIGLSGVLEAIYFLLLGSAYQRGDLSLVYPLARGSAILFVALLAWSVLGERVPLLGLVGITLIVGGVYVLHLRTLDRQGLVAPLRSLRERSSQLAVLTGLTIAAYSVVDKEGIRYSPPLPYLYLTFLVAGLCLAPYMLRVRAPAVRREWQANGARIAVVAVLFVAAFVLVLGVLAGSRVSYVSSVREMSVVVTALLGAVVLREPFGEKKVVGALLIFAGILSIGLAR
jgi:drug/metabolite transporter (DMT)-like permease